MVADNAGGKTELRLSGMTERLYYTDSYTRDFFDAARLEAPPMGAPYTSTAPLFYPTSGGQPFDLGSIAGSSPIVSGGRGERIAHVLGRPVLPSRVAGESIGRRRFDHMQQHSGQHSLSAVFEELFSLPRQLPPRRRNVHPRSGRRTVVPRIAEAERRANDLVSENRPVGVRFEDATSCASRPIGGTIASSRSRSRPQRVRRHPRTHHRRDRPIFIRKVERVKQLVRLEFLCGMSGSAARGPTPSCSQGYRHRSRRPPTSCPR